MLEKRLIWNTKVKFNYLDQVKCANKKYPIENHEHHNVTLVVKDAENWLEMTTHLWLDWLIVVELHAIEGYWQLSLRIPENYENFKFDYFVSLLCAASLKWELRCWSLGFEADCNAQVWFEWNISAQSSRHTFDCPTTFIRTHMYTGAQVVKYYVTVLGVFAYLLIAI